MGFLLGNTSFAEEANSLPKAGFIKNNGTNIRAGDNVNFESLYKLEKNDPVKIVDKRYSWFKVKLPTRAHIYIKSDYIDLTPEDNTIGTVNAIRVNLRAGPGTKYSILTQISNPETVQIVSEKNGWYEIKPFKETYGWIHSSQISFATKLIR